MKKITVDGREIRTNYGDDLCNYGGYPILGDRDMPTMIMERMEWVLGKGEKYRHLEGEGAMFNRLVARGYSRITFYRCTTSIRGCYDIVAMCKY